MLLDNWLDPISAQFLVILAKRRLVFRRLQLDHLLEPLLLQLAVVDEFVRLRVIADVSFWLGVQVVLQRSFDHLGFKIAVLVDEKGWNHSATRELPAVLLLQLGSAQSQGQVRGVVLEQWR